MITATNKINSLISDVVAQDIYIGSDQKTLRPIGNLSKNKINSITKINHKYNYK